MCWVVLGVQVQVRLGVPGSRDGHFQSSETTWQNCKSMAGCEAFIERPDESLCKLFSFTYKLTFLLGPRLGND